MPGTEIMAEVTEVDRQKRCYQCPFKIDFHLETAYNPYMTKHGYPIGQTNHPVTIDTYIQNVNKLFLHGKATEHSYRSDLQVLLSELLPDCQVTNEPKRIDCGAPDYINTRNEIPVGYIEAKDIGLDLTGKNLQEQFDRYKAALDNLIFTDYLAFRFYQKAAFVAEIRIGTIENGHIGKNTEKIRDRPIFYL